MTREMPVLINFKICDNSKECSGIEVCPVGAIYWDERKKTVATDNSKCLSCQKCESVCPVGAIRVARSEREYQKMKKEIEEDPRRISDLFVDRYGAQPVQGTFLISEDEIGGEVAGASKLCVVEMFGHSSIECLLYSVSISELFRGVDIQYRKTELKNDFLMKKYKIKKLPCLLFFKNGKLIGKIHGYYDIKKKKELKEKVKKIVVRAK